MRAIRGERTKRLIGGVTAVSAAAVALIMIVSPLATAAVTPAVFKGAVSDPSYNVNWQGCGVAKSSEPKWSKTTGILHWLGSSTSTTCKKVLDGVGSSSSADSGFSENLGIPLKISSTATGLNVTWSMVAGWTEKAANYTAKGCPSYKYNYSYNYGWSWVNTTYTDSDCSIDASVNLYGSVYLVDETTGSYYYPSNYWNGLYRSFDEYNDSYSGTTTYSNSSYWQDNYSYSDSYGYRSGSIGSGAFTPANSPVWWINGTFSGHDTYVLFPYLDGSVSTDCYGSGKASSIASLDLSSGTNGATLKVTIY